MGVTEFYGARTDTKTTIAAERLAGVVVVASIGAGLVLRVRSATRLWWYWYGTPARWGRGPCGWFS